MGTLSCDLHVVTGRQRLGWESSEGPTGMDVQDGLHLRLAVMLAVAWEQLGLLSRAGFSVYLEFFKPWQLDSKRKHPKRRHSKSPGQKLQNFA